MKSLQKFGKNLLCSSVICGLAVLRAVADEAPSVAAQSSAPDKTFTGTVLCLDNNEHILYLRGWLSQRKAFNLGESCAYSLQGGDSSPVNSVQAGQKVTIIYQDRHGVLIASRIQDVPMRLEGTVESIDLTNHTLVVHEGVKHTKLSLTDLCPVKLRGGTAGTLADIKPGSYVTVTYLAPGDVKTTRQIAQTSIEFTGELTGIDLENRTLKARAVFGSKEFHLSDHCAVVINGRPNGKLADLRPEERLVFSYDNIDGVNVVDRIAPADQAQGHVAASGNDQGY